MGGPVEEVKLLDSDLVQRLANCEFFINSVGFLLFWFIVTSGFFNLDLFLNSAGKVALVQESNIVSYLNLVGASVQQFLYFRFFENGSYFTQNFRLHY